MSEQDTKRAKMHLVKTEIPFVENWRGDLTWRYWFFLFFCGGGGGLILEGAI